MEQRTWSVAVQVVVDLGMNDVFIVEYVVKHVEHVQMAYTCQVASVDSVVVVDNLDEYSVENVIVVFGLVEELDGKKHEMTMMGIPSFHDLAP